MHIRKTQYTFVIHMYIYFFLAGFALTQVKSQARLIRRLEAVKAQTETEPGGLRKTRGTSLERAGGHETPKLKN